MNSEAARQFPDTLNRSDRLNRRFNPEDMLPRPVICICEDTVYAILAAKAG